VGRRSGEHLGQVRYPTERLEESLAEEAPAREADRAVIGMLINLAEEAALTSRGRGGYCVIHLAYPFLCSHFEKRMQARGSERVCQTADFSGFLMSLRKPPGIQQRD
jgi:hypothetical protein